LTTLSFEFYVHKHHAFLASSISENQKAAKIFKRRFLKKGWTITHEKVSLFVKHGFSLEKKYPLQLSHEESGDSCLSNDTKDVGFGG
jgi:hypothetical protein